MTDTVTVAPGVTRNNCHWGYYLEGTMDALIASGLTKKSWFSDWSERRANGNVVRLKRLFIDGRNVETTRPARGECLVRVHYTQDEEWPVYEAQLEAKNTSIARASAAAAQTDVKFQCFMSRVLPGS